MVEENIVPPSFSATCIVPILKKASLDPHLARNYRPVALTTVLSKILETVVARRCAQSLETTPNQFGFKTKCDTNTALAVFLETINTFNQQGSPVYACFLDATAAFDNVRYDTLFPLLQSRGMPSDVVGFLRKWYETQQPWYDGREHHPTRSACGKVYGRVAVCRRSYLESTST
jgi:hypothetical protein